MRAPGPPASLRRIDRGQAYALTVDVDRISVYDAEGLGLGGSGEDQGG